MPDHTVVFISLSSRDEAHFCCALLNSSPAGLAVASYITLHPSPHVLEHIRLPRFATHDKQHARLSMLSQRAHELATKEDEKSLKKLAELETEVDLLASAVWAISESELRDIQTSLNDLR